MDTETLVCNSCSKKWKRTKTRGRKPVTCPKCAPTLVQKTIDKKVSEPKVASNSSVKYPVPSNWTCSSCQVSVKIYVRLEYPPMHCCKKRLSKEYPLEMV